METELGAWLFEALCQLGVGLMCFCIGTAQLKKCLGELESGSLRRHRIQSVEGLVLDLHAKETSLKRDQSGPLEIKKRSFLEGPDGKSVEAFTSS